MTFKVKKSGSFADPAAVKRKPGGSWTDVGFVKAKEGGVWVTVWPIPILITITNQIVRRISDINTLAQYTLNSSGIVQNTLGASTTTIETWLQSGAAGDYEVRATVASGDTPGGSALNTWLALSTTRSWSLQDVGVDGISLLCDLTVEIRLASSGVVQDTATITIESEQI